MASGSKIHNKYAFRTYAAIAKVKKILNILSEKSLCRHDIAKEIHVTYKYSKMYIDYLLAEKKIYISAWKLEEKGSRVMHWPYYRAGDNPSKPKPPNLTREERCKRYREKLSKDADRREKRNRKRRVNRVKIKPDWTTAWILASNTIRKNADGA
jgi:hypothetical protein